MADGTDLRITRTSPILTARTTQLSRNYLAQRGGGPYIDERLNRFTSESPLSWEGDSTTGVPSRKNRAFLINYAGRVIAKIVQYVFSQGVAREGIDEEFQRDATKTKQSIDQVMKGVAGAYVAGGWCWIGVDRGTPGIDALTGERAIRSIRARKEAGDRVFWSMWQPDEVVDWAFDDDGDLKWLITQEDTYEAPSPSETTYKRRMRTVWEKGKGTRLVMKPDSNTALDTATEFTFGVEAVPFVLVGHPSDKPWWFDDVERVQASMLNLDSAHHESLIRCVFPQLVIPTSLISEIMAKSDRVFTDALDLVRGIEWPLMEPPESKNLTRFISPEDTDLGAIPKEILRRRKELFEIVGQALQQESRELASAESKAWDNKGIEATLADHAEVFEEAELKAVELSKALDTSFKGYVPTYSRQFDLPDIETDFRILTEMEQGDLPDAIRRELIKTKVRILDKIVKLPTKTLNDALAEIETMDLDDTTALAAMAAAARGTPPGAPEPEEEEGEGEDE